MPTEILAFPKNGNSGPLTKNKDHFKKRNNPSKPWKDAKNTFWPVKGILAILHTYFDLVLECKE